jgi:3-hydroxyacyl-[acyl-carrier-protein] dehydratase
MQESSDMRIDRFQLVDRITALDCRTPLLTAAARVPEEHAIFSGHFPGHPVMPGVLLAELMAQCCGFLLLSLNAFKRMPFLAALKEINFRSFVVPGTMVSCLAMLEHDGSGYAVLRAKVLRAGEDKRVCDGVLTFRILDYPSQALREHMLERALEVGLSVGAGGVVLAHEGAR